MESSCFDAVIDVPPSAEKQTLNALLCIRGTKIPASFFFYGQAKEEGQGHFFVMVQSSQPLLLRWMDRFEIEEKGKLGILGKGKVLSPLSEKILPKKIKKRENFLRQLLGDEKQMIFAVVHYRGIHGVTEKGIISYSPLSRETILRFSQDLEAEGKIRILAFSPLFLLSQASFEFLCEKIIAFLSRFHKKHPDELGASFARIQKRFDLNPRILSLALRYLSREAKIKEIENRVALFDFEIFLLPEEKEILNQMEEMCLKGEFQAVSLKYLKEYFNLSTKKFNVMLSLLIERKKIVQGKDGFLLHSRWLEEIISKVRNSGKKELTVSDFKKMTGLTRKYVIPLLELLDQMGITRRRGAIREIL